MKVLDLIRFNPNWEEKLAQEHYFVKATWKGDYVVLKYNQLASDFTNEIVRECRGCIFYIPKHNHAWADVVCYPFDKFGNYGESYVPNLDWATAKVKEKVDGSLIKVWYHKGEWHVSTNSTVDARDADSHVEGISFYDVFMRALAKNGNSQDFFFALDINYTYMFELVSPDTRVTIEYPEDAIYYLGARSMSTLLEEAYPTRTKDHLFFSFVKLPKIYSLTTLKDCIEVANKMGADEEGFVACDQHFNRVKIKSPEYLIAAKMRNNNIITVRNVLRMMMNDTLDDFIAYAPDHKPFVDKVVDAFNHLARDLFTAYSNCLVELASEQKPWYQIVQTVDSKFRDYCFKRYAGKFADAYDYLFHGVFECNLVDWIKEYIKDC